MSVMTDIKKTVDTTPFFAAVGATDLAVEKVREARVRADKVRAELSADLAPAKVQAGNQVGDGRAIVKLEGFTVQLHAHGEAVTTG